VCARHSGRCDVDDPSPGAAQRGRLRADRIGRHGNQPETATSDILASAEQIQEIAWTMREQGFDGEVCDLLDSKATDVYTSCSFQDLTGQRTRKVIQVLRYLEGRINAMIGIWGLDGAMAAEAAEAKQASGDAALLNGPALPGQGLDQTDVDVVMGPAETAQRPAEAAPVAAAPTTTAEVEPEVEVEVEAAVEPAPEIQPDVGAEPEDEIVPEVMAETEGEPVAAAATSEPEPVAPPLQPAEETAPLPRPARSSGDPLAAVAALSYEEKIALFT
jgi:chemotaxis protein CheZ